MAIWTSEKIEKEAVEVGASMMALSARTAPKARGVDSIKTMILTGTDLEQLAVAMEKKIVLDLIAITKKSINIPSSWLRAFV